MKSFFLLLVFLGYASLNAANRGHLPGEGRNRPVSEGRGTIRLDLPKELRGMSCKVEDLRFSPDGKKIILSFHHGLIATFDAGNGKLLSTIKDGALETPKGQVQYSVNSRLSPDGKLAIVGGSVGESKPGTSGPGGSTPVRIIDTETKKVLYTFPKEPEIYLRDAGFSEDNKNLIVSEKDSADIYNLTKIPPTLEKTFKGAWLWRTTPDGFTFLSKKDQTTISEKYKFGKTESPDSSFELPQNSNAVVLESEKRAYIHSWDGRSSLLKDLTGKRPDFKLDHTSMTTFTRQPENVATPASWIQGFSNKLPIFVTYQAQPRTSPAFPVFRDLKTGMALQLADAFDEFIPNTTSYLSRGDSHWDGDPKQTCPELYVTNFEKKFLWPFEEALSKIPVKDQVKDLGAHLASENGVKAFTSREFLLKNPKLARQVLTEYAKHKIYLPPPNNEDLKRLVGKLGDKNFKEREKASNELLKIAVGHREPENVLADIKKQYADIFSKGDPEALERIERMEKNPSLIQVTRRIKKPEILENKDLPLAAHLHVLAKQFPGPEADAFLNSDLGEIAQKYGWGY